MIFFLFFVHQIWFTIGISIEKVTYIFRQIEDRIEVWLNRKGEEEEEEEEDTGNEADESKKEKLDDVSN